jgi:hypothetical protein
MYTIKFNCKTTFVVLMDILSNLMSVTHNRMYTLKKKDLRAVPPSRVGIISVMNIN